MVVRCADPAVEAAVVSEAEAHARDSWHGSRAALLAGVDAAAGTYDWVLAALDQPVTPSG